MLHGVGVDVVDVDRLARMIDRYGETFLARWFSERERTDCSEDRMPARAFSARFAIKEAVWKALGMGRRTDPPPWRQISARYDVPTDAWTVELGGALAVSAHKVHVTSIHCTVSVAGGVATAVAHAYAAAAGDERRV